jgi:hypothetical protein
MVNQQKKLGRDKIKNTVKPLVLMTAVPIEVISEM